MALLYCISFETNLSEAAARAPRNGNRTPGGICVELLPKSLSFPDAA
eukprot:COSAG06_NODE_5934_length_3200_cov_29.593035_3_plen_47_part_00